MMKTTRYFDEQVLRKRPYISLEICEIVLTSPLGKSVQADNRVRYWGEVIDPRNGKKRILRVVTLVDEETIHNAFFDRNFQKARP